ncbi:MAG TPA: enoyl-CoA hydratase/isomerase family protein [Devosia sp.]|nr:enoyl-CoA hydratase/isomerase family protein [Devosia sp.]
MTLQLEISTEGPLGVVALNRPEAINALSGEMIAGIAEVLTEWRDDPAIRLVLFEGRGPRGFCAGGDVRVARQLVLDGRAEAADAYFAAEYAMNLLIATYPKPIAAIAHGAVMGGGLGIFGHCHYRFAVTGARFAMPEAAIGFVSDVGINALLKQVPEPRALAFLLSGMSVGLGDALVLGLCDAAIDPGARDGVRAGIAAAAAGDVETALVQLMHGQGIAPDEATLCAAADMLAPAFAGTSAAEIAEGLAAEAADAVPEGLRAGLATGSPTSLEAILASHRAARRLPDIAEVLRLDGRMAALMVRQPDFAEGVRAVLVDKDRRPRWRPAALADVDRAAIAAAAIGAGVA